MASSLDSPEKLLESLVRIPSGTRNVAGVEKVQRIVKSELEALGLSARLVPNPDAGQTSASLLEANLPGSDLRTITLVAHADTVFEQDSGFEGYHLSSDGKIARGPGVIDDKGGIVVALLALRTFVSKNEARAFSIRFVCAPSEEIGSQGFHGLFQDYSKDALMVLGLEPGLDDGSIVESRRGNRWYDIDVQGREAHAGRAHAQGINAAHELSIKLDRLSQLTDHDRDITVSIGHVSAGNGKHNIVCGHAHAKVDVRFPDFPSRDQVTGQVDQILKETHVRSRSSGETASTRYRLADDCPPFSTTEYSRPYLEKYRRIVEKREGRVIGSARAGGAADCNYMSRDGLIVLDGLGPLGGGMHTTEEFIRLDTLQSRSQALAEFLESAMSELSQ